MHMSTDDGEAESWNKSGRSEGQSERSGWMRGRRENSSFCLWFWLRKRRLILRSELQHRKSEACKQDYLSLTNEHTHSYTYSRCPSANLNGVKVTLQSGQWKAWPYWAICMNWYKHGNASAFTERFNTAAFKCVLMLHMQQHFCKHHY